VLEHNDKVAVIENMQTIDCVFSSIFYVITITAFICLLANHIAAKKLV